MQHKINFQPVNWADGMKINKSHFIASQHAMIDSVRDTEQHLLTPFSYGLIASDDAYPIDISITIDNQNFVKVKLLRCNAISIGGARIHIEKELIEKGFVQTAITQQISTQESSIFWISVSVNLFDRTPYGIPDTAESPTRIHFTLPSYQLHITADNQIKQVLSNPNHFIVGKVLLNGSQSSVDEEYIPACTKVSAHADLLSFHAEVDSFLGKLELKSSLIVQKILKKNQQNELSELVMFLCDRMVLTLGQTITHFRWITPEQSPVQMIAYTVGLARIIKNTIDLRIGSGKEELLNYLAEWCDVNQGELETLLTSIANMQYTHHDINQNLIKIIKFVKVVGKLFDTLSNLEFIGKKKESNIFVKEEQMNTQADDINKPKPKRRFFAD